MMCAPWCGCVSLTLLCCCREGVLCSNCQDWRLLRYVSHGGMYVVGVTKRNCNPAGVLSISQACRRIQSVSRVSSDERVNSLKFSVLVYELLDETMDYGHLKFLPLWASSISRLELWRRISKISEPVDNNRITSRNYGCHCWRQPGKYRYKKNEVYIDAQSVNLHMSSESVVLRSDGFR